MEGIFRDEFPLLASKTYFLTCAISPLAKRVKHSLLKFIEEWDNYGALALGMPDGWGVKIDKAREKFANLINAEKDQIAYSFGVSVSSASLLSCFDLSNKNEFIFSDLDFPSVPNNIMAMQDHGGTYKIAKSQNGEVDITQFIDHCNEKTALISISEVMANNGYRIRTNEFIEKSHDKGVPVILDTFQSSGYIPMDVRKNNVDFLVSGIQKYLLGGFGMSFMYIREDWLEKLNPSAIGWFGVEDPFDALFNGLPEKLIRPKDARKFHAGGPSVNGAITGIAGMDLIEEIGIERIKHHNLEITQELIDKVLELGYSIQTPIDKENRGSIVNIEIPNVKLVVEELKKRNIVVDFRLGGIRVAPHFYNNSKDIDFLIENILDIRKRI